MTRLSGARVWERRLVESADGEWIVPLRFRVVPGVWPDIELAPADGTRADVTAELHELRFEFDPRDGGTLDLDVAGFELRLAGRVLTGGGVARELPGSGPIELVLTTHGDTATLAVDEAEPVVISGRRAADSATVSPVTANVTGFRMFARDPAEGRIRVGGDGVLSDAVVYGLRPAETPLYRTARAVTVPGATLYTGEGFSVRDGEVADIDRPAALVPDRRTIVSPIRVVEEFAWRDNPYGDMTRVADRAELWRSSVEPGRFLDFGSGFRSVDAAFELALETFQRNSSPEFSLPGQDGVWSAGYFQGSGLGFGSWKRDTCHIALRSGSLIDPEVARASLVSVVDSAFDNGADGDSLPAVAIWDHYLATGDETIVSDTWLRLATSAAVLDARFDEQRGLVLAPQSTSNDFFDEPETGGYALSTEIYSMETYAALGRMAQLGSIRDPRADAWADRASAMRRAILSQYWNPDRGFFTSGPIGSDSYENGYWETSGSEAAMWGFLGADAEPRLGAVLAAGRELALGDYGFELFPYRHDDNHFCNSVWYCWQAGIARAAARSGDSALVHRLIGQQTRTAVLNKTFYEVTDARSGESWRWPGQLWHAAGFISLVLYGLFGIRYDRVGMTFTPAVAAEFAGARIDGLRYRGAVLDVEIQGSGTRCEVTIDGRRVDRVAADCTGRHSIVLRMMS